MDAEAVREYFARRPGLVSPWPEELWKESPPTIFLVRTRNQTRDEVQFDPAMVALSSQDGECDRPIPYEEMYMRLAEAEDAAPRLVSLQATLLSRFVVIPPGGHREGIPEQTCAGNVLEPTTPYGRLRSEGRCFIVD